MSAWNAVSRRYVYFVVTTGMAAYLAGCVKDSGAAPKTGAGTVNAAAASPDAGAVTIMIDNSAALASLPFLADTSASVASGSHTIAVNGSAPGAAPITNTAIQIASGATYDYILARLATGGGSNLQLLGGVNPPTSIDPAANAAVRFYNAIADTGALASTADIYVADSTGAFATAKYAYTGLALFASPVTSAGGNGIYAALPPGTYHVKVTVPGDTTKVVADSTWASSAGQVRTIVAAPSANQAGATLIKIRDAN